MAEKYLSIREVAQIGGVSYETIWEMVRSGELPAVRFRNSVRIPESAQGTLLTYERQKGDEQ